MATSPRVNALLRRASSSQVKTQVSPPYFWDFGVYERIFGNGGTTEKAVGSSSEDTKQIANVSEESAANIMTTSSELNTSSLSDVSPNKKPAWQSTIQDKDLTSYIVAFGDTYESIALKHDMTAVELRRANPGVQFYSRPTPGQELKVRRLRRESIDSEESKGDGMADVKDVAVEAPAPSSPKHHDGVERAASLCFGPYVRVVGRIIVGITSGFVLFEPEEYQRPSVQTPVKMLFAVDRKDVLGCAAVSKISARVRNDEEDPTMLLQIIWKNAELGFSNEQQMFFEVAASDIAVLVDAIYASEPVKKVPRRRQPGTLTSGVAALRVLEEEQRSLAVEDFVNIARGEGLRGGSEEDLVLEVSMFPHDSNLISKEQAVSIANSLPSRLRNGYWELLYDFEKDGISLHALYAAAKQHSESLLLVRNLKTSEVIGAFTLEAWDPSNGKGFFGSGESTVFRIGPGTNDADVFEWSGVNEFFQSCSPTHLGVGGGGNFAMCLDGDLMHCTSGPCLTFKGLESRPLASSLNFKIDGIELWAIHSLQKPRGSTLGSLEDETQRGLKIGGRSASDRSTVLDSSAVVSNEANNIDDMVVDDYVRI